MSYIHSIEKLVNIQGLEKINVEEIGNHLVANVELRVERHICPSCGTKTKRIHDYRIQKIKTLSSCGKQLFIMLRKRRYVCKKCGKRFYEKTPWLGKYARMTKVMIEHILNELRELKTYTSVGKEHHVSPQTVIRLFDYIQYPKPTLPIALSIDEFKGNTGGEKYNCIIADPINHQVLDILPKRTDYAVDQYFLGFSKEDRQNVQIFVSDMWKPYQNAARDIFSQSMRVIDKYHWIRQVVWAFERVRKKIQKHLPKDKRIYFKHSRNLLLKPFHSLSDEDKQAVNIMLFYSAELSSAYCMKEEFQKILRATKRAEAKLLMDHWIDNALSNDLLDFVTCAKTFVHWKREILNSFTTTCTNGFIEGCNNKIKVLKRISFGCRNFRRFRNRILHIFSNQTMNLA